VYHIEDEVIDLIHTEVPKELGGRGIGNELVRAALEFAAQEDLLVRPTCRFVSAYLKRHPAAAKLTGRRDD
jgi:predicted GNAT family acetyltransferase